MPSSGAEKNLERHKSRIHGPFSLKEQDDHVGGEGRVLSRNQKECKRICEEIYRNKRFNAAQSIIQASPISLPVSLPIRFGLSSLCASNSPMLTSLMPKAPPSALVP